MPNGQFSLSTIIETSRLVNSLTCIMKWITWSFWRIVTRRGRPESIFTGKKPMNGIQ